MAFPPNTDAQQQISLDERKEIFKIIGESYTKIEPLLVSNESKIDRKAVEQFLRQIDILIAKGEGTNREARRARQLEEKHKLKAVESAIGKMEITGLGEEAIKGGKHVEEADTEMGGY